MTPLLKMHRCLQHNRTQMSVDLTEKHGKQPVCPVDLTILQRLSIGRKLIKAIFANNSHVREVLAFRQCPADVGVCAV